MLLSRRLTRRARRKTSQASQSPDTDVDMKDSSLSSSPTASNQETTAVTSGKSIESTSQDSDGKKDRRRTTEEKRKEDNNRRKEQRTRANKKASELEEDAKEEDELEKASMMSRTGRLKEGVIKDKKAETRPGWGCTLMWYPITQGHTHGSRRHDDGANTRDEGEHGLKP